MDPQQDNKDSSLDKLNQLAKGAKNLKRGIRIIRTAQSSIQTVQVFLGGISTIGWAIITTLIVVTLFAFLISMLGAGGLMPSSPPKCDNPTAEPQAISPSLPTTLSITGCAENATYSWILPQIGGVFSASQSAITSYTPPRVSGTTKTSIVVNVCLASSLDNCSQYSTPEIIITNSSPGPGPVLVPPCNQVWDRLKSVFGASVYLGNTSIKNSSCHQLQAIYRTYATAGKSSYYYSLLKKAGPFNIRVFNGARTNSCGGDVLTRNNIKLYVVNESSGYTCFYKNGPTGLLLHETGHQIRQQTQPLIMSTHWLRNLVSQDRTCYDRGFIKSYSLRTTDPASESMAEASMLYIMNSKTNFAPGSLGKAIYNFKRECQSTYNYIKRAVFGNDYEFN